ncbi:hypothetical protein [Floridanema aerugineum]|uniref:Uncharacterized protein n=1 Tax=Floridaenema aerugineum BLCC-F46 TaxID=3153654 RepID=A0ABV4X1W9_9CYAN
MVGNNAWQKQVKNWIETDYPHLKSTEKLDPLADKLDYMVQQWISQANLKYGFSTRR